MWCFILLGIGNIFLNIMGMKIYVIIVLRIKMFEVFGEIVFNFLVILVVVIISDKVDVSKKVDVMVVLVLN